MSNVPKIDKVVVATSIILTLGYYLRYLFFNSDKVFQNNPEDTQNKLNEVSSDFLVSFIAILGFIPSLAFLCLLVWGVIRKERWVENFEGILITIGIGFVASFFLAIPQVFAFIQKYW